MEDNTANITKQFASICLCRIFVSSLGLPINIYSIDKLLIENHHRSKGFNFDFLLWSFLSANFASVARRRRYCQKWSDLDESHALQCKCVKLCQNSPSSDTFSHFTQIKTHSLSSLNFLETSKSIFPYFHILLIFLIFFLSRHHLSKTCKKNFWRLIQMKHISCPWAITSLMVSL